VDKYRLIISKSNIELEVKFNYIVEYTKEEEMWSALGRNGKTIEPERT
jgi:hypothetical protein